MPYHAMPQNLDKHVQPSIFRRLQTTPREDPPQATDGQNYVHDPSILLFHPCQFRIIHSSPPASLKAGSLHKYASSAATSTFLALADLHLARGVSVSRATTSTCRVACHLFVVASDFADDVVECVVNVDARFGGGFDEFAAKGSGECFTLYKGTSLAYWTSKV